MEVIGFLRKQGYRGSCFDKRKHKVKPGTISTERHNKQCIKPEWTDNSAPCGGDDTHLQKKKRGMSPKMCSSAIRQQFLSISEDTAFQKVIVHFMNFEFWREFSCCLNGVVHSLIDNVKTKLFVCQMRDIFLSLVLLMS